MISMNLSDIAILNNKRADYCCITCGFSKSEAINLMPNANLTEQNFLKDKNQLSHIKMSKVFLTFDIIEIEKKRFYLL